MAGSLPDLAAPPSGCRFHPRCPKAMPVCATQEPPDVRGRRAGIRAKCWLSIAGATSRHDADLCHASTFASTFRSSADLLSRASATCRRSTA